MSITNERVGAVILAGGQSSRMGCCKALLTVHDETLLSFLASELESFDELLLSSNDPVLLDGLRAKFVPDVYPYAGPMGGLHAALSASHNDALFCVPCDLPYYSESFGAFLVSAFPSGADALVCEDSTGRLHPLPGIYAKSALSVLEEQLNTGNYRMRDMLHRLNYVIRLNTSSHFPDTVFINLNTPEEYKKFCTQTKTLKKYV